MLQQNAALDRHVDRFTAFTGFRLIGWLSPLVPLFIGSFLWAALTSGWRSNGVRQNRLGSRLSRSWRHQRLLARILRWSRYIWWWVKRRYLHNTSLSRITGKKKVNKNFSYFGKEPDRPLTKIRVQEIRVIFLRLFWLTTWLRKIP